MKGQRKIIKRVHKNAKRQRRERELERNLEKEISHSEEKPGEAPHSHSSTTPEERAVAKVNRALRRKYKDDPRGRNVISQVIVPKQVNDTLAINVDVQDQIWAGPIIAVISHAYRSGYLLFAQGDSRAAFAFQYMTLLLRVIAQGGTPQSMQVPRWLNILCQAVSTTERKVAGKTISYSFNSTGGTNLGWSQPIGPVSYSNQFLMGVKTSTVVNGLYAVMGPSLPYSEQLGREASQHIWMFLKNQHEGDPMHELVDLGTQTSMSHDPSAFAYFDNVPGGGYSGSGGWFKQIYNEIPVTSPAFSVFATRQAAILPSRGANYLIKGSGDAITLGSLLVDGFTEDNIHMRNAPIVQYVDFLEFAEVLCLILQQAITIRTETADFVENMANNPNYFEEVVQLPLTLQNLLILFKSQCQLILSDTLRYQGTFPSVPVSQSDKRFVVYPEGANTAPLQMGGMMNLPRILIENLLALTSRVVEPGESGEKNPRMYYTALGQVQDHVLSAADYNVSYVIGGVTITKSIFASSVGETQISLVDGQYSDGAGTFYAFINDPAVLVPAAASWNEYVDSIGDNLRMLDTVTVDGGVAALSLVGMTDFYFTASRGPRPKIFARDFEAPKPKVQVTNVSGKNCNRQSKSKEAVLALGTSAYLDRKLVACSMSYEIFNAAWVEFQQFFIKGACDVFPPTTQQNNNGFGTVSALLGQTSTLAYGEGGDIFVSLYDRHVSLAALCVKQRLADPSSQDKILTKLAEEGEAGILGDLAGAIVGNVGTTAVAVGAQMLGQAIPF